jgi:carboxyl-terminal processing protease
MAAEQNLTPLAPHSAPGPSEPGARPGRLLAVVLLIVLAFSAGAAVERASSNDSSSVPPVAVGPTATARPGATSVATPSATGQPGQSGGTAAASPGAPTPSPVVTPGPTIGPGATIPPYAPANIGLVWDALKTIEQNFVRRSTLNPTDLTYGMIEGLVNSLGDPGHTVFLTPEEVKSENDALSGSITGIGVFLGEQAGVPVIVSVISGSPAARSGLLSGDRLIAVDGKSAESLSLSEIAAEVRGPEGTKVTVTVIHPDSATPVDVTIVRAKITVPAVIWAMVPGTKIADIQITQFSAGAGNEFITAVRGARQAGATAIVLDLRDNPGGYVGEAVTVASQLLASGNVYVREMADGKQIPVPVKPGGTATDIPLAVLINFGSASSSEITAGALQDPKRGPLIGVRTYGTGTVLDTFPLPDGSALRLGVEEWLTPTGRHIFPLGITPDIQVELPTATQPLTPDTLRTMSASGVLASGDTQLLKALDVLRTP